MAFKGEYAFEDEETTNVSAALKILATYSKHKQISDLIRVGEEFLKGK